MERQKKRNYKHSMKKVNKQYRNFLMKVDKKEKERMKLKKQFEEMKHIDRRIYLKNTYAYFCTFYFQIIILKDKNEKPTQKELKKKYRGNIIPFNLSLFVQNLEQERQEFIKQEILQGRGKTYYIQIFEKNDIKVYPKEEKIKFENNNIKFVKTLFSLQNGTVFIHDIQFRNLDFLSEISAWKLSFKEREKMKGNNYILKVITFNPFDQKTIKLCVEEVNILRKLKNDKNVINIFDSRVLGCELYIIMQKGFCSFKQLINWNIKSRIFYSPNKALNVTLQLIEALKQLHNVEIYHLDVKPQNLVLDIISKTLLIIDFGVSLNISGQNQETLQMKGYTPLYQPTGFDPWIALNQKRLSLMDIYSSIKMFLLFTVRSRKSVKQILSYIQKLKKFIKKRGKITNEGHDILLNELINNLELTEEYKSFFKKYIQINLNKIECSLDDPIIDAIRDFKSEIPKLNKLIYSLSSSSTKNKLAQNYNNFKNFYIKNIESENESSDKLKTIFNKFHDFYDKLEQSTCPLQKDFINFFIESKVNKTFSQIGKHLDLDALLIVPTIIVPFQAIYEFNKEITIYNKFILDFNVNLSNRDQQEEELKKFYKFYISINDNNKEFYKKLTDQQLQNINKIFKPEFFEQLKKVFLQFQANKILYQINNNIDNNIDRTNYLLKNVLNKICLKYQENNLHQIKNNLEAPYNNFGQKFQEEFQQALIKLQRKNVEFKNICMKFIMLKNLSEFKEETKAFNKFLKSFNVKVRNEFLKKVELKKFARFFKSLNDPKKQFLIEFAKQFISEDKLFKPEFSWKLTKIFINFQTSKILNQIDNNLLKPIKYSKNKLQEQLKAILIEFQTNNFLQIDNKEEKPKNNPDIILQQQFERILLINFKESFCQLLQEFQKNLKKNFSLTNKNLDDNSHINNVLKDLCEWIKENSNKLILNFYNVIKTSIDIKNQLQSFNLGLNDPNDIFEEKLKTFYFQFFSYEGDFNILNLQKKLKENVKEFEINKIFNQIEKSLDNPKSYPYSFYKALSKICQIFMEKNLSEMKQNKYRNISTKDFQKNFNKILHRFIQSNKKEQNQNDPNSNHPINIAIKDLNKLIILDEDEKEDLKKDIHLLALSEKKSHKKETYFNSLQSIHTRLNYLINKAYQCKGLGDKKGLIIDITNAAIYIHSLKQYLTVDEFACLTCYLQQFTVKQDITFDDKLKALQQNLEEILLSNDLKTEEFQFFIMDTNTNYKKTNKKYKKIFQAICNAKSITWQKDYLKYKKQPKTTEPFLDILNNTKYLKESFKKLYNKVFKNIISKSNQEDKKLFLELRKFKRGEDTIDRFIKNTKDFNRIINLNKFSQNVDMLAWILKSFVEINKLERNGLTLKSCLYQFIKVMKYQLFGGDYGQIFKEVFDFLTATARQTNFDLQWLLDQLKNHSDERLENVDQDKGFNNNIAQIKSYLKNKEYQLALTSILSKRTLKSIKSKTEKDITLTETIMKFQDVIFKDWKKVIEILTITIEKDFIDTLKSYYQIRNYRDQVFEQASKVSEVIYKMIENFQFGRKNENKSNKPKINKKKMNDQQQPQYTRSILSIKVDVLSKSMREKGKKVTELYEFYKLLEEKGHYFEVKEKTLYLKKNYDQLYCIGYELINQASHYDKYLSKDILKSFEKITCGRQLMLTRIFDVLYKRILLTIVRPFRKIKAKSDAILKKEKEQQKQK